MELQSVGGQEERLLVVKAGGGSNTWQRTGCEAGFCSFWWAFVVIVLYWRESKQKNWIHLLFSTDSSHFPSVPFSSSTLRPLATDSSVVKLFLNRWSAQSKQVENSSSWSALSPKWSQTGIQNQNLRCKTAFKIKATLLISSSLPPLPPNLWGQSVHTSKHSSLSRYKLLDSFCTKCNRGANIDQLISVWMLTLLGWMLMAVSRCLERRRRQKTTALRFVRIKGSCHKITDLSEQEGGSWPLQEADSVWTWDLNWTTLLLARFKK